MNDPFYIQSYLFMNLIIIYGSILVIQKQNHISIPKECKGIMGRVADLTRCGDVSGTNVAIRA